jgi:hypothetical protein
MPLPTVGKFSYPWGRPARLGEIGREGHLHTRLASSSFLGGQVKMKYFATSLAFGTPPDFFTNYFIA